MTTLQHGRRGRIPRLFLHAAAGRRVLLFTVAAVFAGAVRGAGEADGGAYRPIHNDVFWNTADGRPLYSQGGGIFRFSDPRSGKDRYFWYGVRYRGAEAYRADPTVTVENAVFDAVTCYSSDNLTDWTYEGDVLTRDELLRHDRITWVGRLGVARISETGRYALFVQHGAGVLIAEAATPTGAFRWHRRIDMTSRIGTPNTGDQTVFTDDDTGRSYLVYSYGRGRSRIYVSEIGLRGDSIDLLDCTEIFHGASREGNCMFKYRGKYYMCASNIYGWDGSFAYWLAADDIRGPYLPANDMQVMKGCEADYSHVSQTGFFYTLRGTEAETVVYCGDRWADFAGNGLGYNQWVPLSFEGSEPVFNSMSSWMLDAVTGRWRVGEDNNYVRNGSFEADRRRIPNPVKPRQDYILGWQTTVESGRPVAVDDSLSPKLNYFNTRDDRRHVIGEKSLMMSDSVMAFSRRVSQTVESTAAVPLTDGDYVLRAKVRRSGRFSRLEMYAESGGRRTAAKIRQAMTSWTEIEISRVRVSGGRVEIGFVACGEAGAVCLVDDVSLVRRGF